MIHKTYPDGSKLTTTGIVVATVASAILAGVLIVANEKWIAWRYSAKRIHKIQEK